RPEARVSENRGLRYALDLASEKTSKIPMSVASDVITARPEIKSVAARIRTFNLSPSGVRAVFEARGDIVTVPVEHGSARNLTASPGVHELNPVWSPDGKWIAYLSDRTGEYEIYLRPQKGGDEVRVTSDGGVYRYGPLWSPDNKKLLYWDKKLRLWYVDIEKKQPVQIDQGEYGDIEGGDWSPDSRWAAYAKPGPNLSSAIYLYSILTGGGEVLRDRHAQPLLLEPVGEVVQAALHLAVDERLGNVVGDERGSSFEDLLPHRHRGLHAGIHVEAGAHVALQPFDGVELADLAHPLVGELRQHLLLGLLDQ